MIDNTFTQFLSTTSKPVVLDGGLATELEAQGLELNSDLWSAEILSTSPEVIKDVHLVYLNAGAQIIISASYQASIKGFVKSGYSEAESFRLLNLSVQIALEAKNQHLAENPDSDVFVAASIGPYGAYLADGSEYTGSYGVSDSELVDFHSSRIEILGKTDIDLLACETIPCHREAEILGKLLMDSHLPAWLSFSCRDGSHINDGTVIGDVVQKLAGHPSIIAIGVNCTPPQYIEALIQSLRNSAPSKAIVVYPNSGELYDAQTNSWLSTGNRSDISLLAKRWNTAGANIIGGCCRIGPNEISEISRLFNT